MVAIGGEWRSDQVMTEPAPQDDAFDAGPAGIAYHGVAGSSYDCLDAVKALLQCRVRLPRVSILTAGNEHALLLFTEADDPIAVKSGFASGYGGTGPKTFSKALQVLELFGADIEEVLISEEAFRRLEASALTRADYEQIKSAPPRRPSRWHDYIFDKDFERSRQGQWVSEFDRVMPFGIIDPRLADLALTFWDDPDARLSLGYRRLEEAVRTRTGLKSSSTRLFSDAFGDKGCLTWELPDPGEASGRAQLFSAVFRAYRNPRAHRPPETKEALAEFLLLNQLFLLEAEAIPIERGELGET